MDFRLINEETLPQAADLWDECFEKKDTPFHQWYFKDYCLKQNRILGGFQDGRLATMLHLNPYVLQLRGRAWKVPYIVGVATDPVDRGSHVMGQLMETTFTMLRAMKVPFVILMPIFAGIYQPYGFSYTYLRKQYKLPLAQLDFAGSTLQGFTVKRGNPGEYQAEMAAIYAKAMESYHGYAIRDERVWNNTIVTAQQENFQAVILEEDGAPKAYALYNKEGMTIFIQEMLSVDAPSQIRLFQYFKGLAGTYTTLDYLAPEDDLTYLRLKDQSLAPQEKPFMMGRVLNAAQCLKALPYGPELVGRELVMGLKDEQIALNTMLVKLRFTDHGLELLNTVDDATVLMDEAAFTQLFFGAYSVNDLLKAGMIFVADKESKEVLEKLFPKENNFINEYF